MGIIQRGFFRWVFSPRVEGEEDGEFMNLLQGRMSVQEYPLKFTRLSKYDPTMVAIPRVRMNKFVIGLLILVEKECRMAMILNGMDISRLMV